MADLQWDYFVKLLVSPPHEDETSPAHIAWRQMKELVLAQGYTFEATADGGVNVIKPDGTVAVTARKGSHG